MSAKPVLFKIIAAFMVVTIISGCNLKSNLSVPTAAPTMAATMAATITPTLAPTDTSAPTLDQNLVNTQAAQTAVANMTLNAPTATPVTPTSTSTTVPTMTLTFTPLPPTAYPTATFIPWTSTPTATPIVYSCAVTSTTPSSTDTVKVSTAFNWSWVIKNTGKWAWGQHQADIKYVSGTIMQTNGYLFDMPADVSPGVSVTVKIAMKTPASAGTYTATWEIVQEGVLVCTLPLSVKVTN